MVATQTMRAFAGMPLRQTVCPHTHIAQRTTAHTGATLAAGTGIYAEAAVAYQQLVKERAQHITFQPWPCSTQHFTLVKRCPAGHTRRHMCHALTEGAVFTLLHVRTVHIEPPANIHRYCASVPHKRHRAATPHASAPCAIARRHTPCRHRRSVQHKRTCA